MSLRATNTSIFYNGRIFTSNPEQPYASAMVVQDGRITWIGESEHLPAVDGDRVDLIGRRVLPGFIDAHMHPLVLADTEQQIPCMPPVVKSIADLKNAIRRHREERGEGAWIRCWGYDEGKLLEGRAPTRWDLDEAAADVPVIVTRTCSHIAVVNSFALKLAGIDKGTPNPQGGQIDKDTQGEPTGVLRENAKDLVFRVMPAPSLDSDADLLAGLSQKLSAHGITAITEMMARTQPVDYFDMYNVAREKGLKQRTVLYYLWEELKNQQAVEDLVAKKCSTNAIFVGGVKLFADGSVSGQTAWVNPPFLGDGENCGIATTSREELLAAAEFAEKNGLQVAVHAMGEQAIDFVVDTFHGRQGWLANTPSLRIEHASLPTKQAIEQAAKTGIGFVPQPIFLYAEVESYLNNLGADRMKQSYPIQSMLKFGVSVAFSSDAPMTAWPDPSNPFVGLKAAVTRVAYDGTDTGQEQRVALETGIELYTRFAQQITGIPDVGQLKPGYHGDFIVLDEDVLGIDVMDIDKVHVEETYIGGSLVYQKSEMKGNSTSKLAPNGLMGSCS